MVIYMLYEHLVREYKALLRLKKKFEKRGDEVYIYSAIFERNSFAKHAKKNPPDVILMPWFFCEADEKILYPVLKKNPKVRVISLHHEELTIPGNESYFLSKTDYTKYGAFHFVWGDYFGSFLKEDGVPEDRVFITGNVRSDLISSKTVSREELAETYHLDPKKKWILFAETLGYYSQRISESEKAALFSRGVTEEEIENGRRDEQAGIQAAIEDFSSLGIDFRDTYELIYRPHPGTYAFEGFPEWLNIIQDRPISDWIANVDFFVSRRSTSVFEADAAGVPCAMYENPPTPPELLIPGLDLYPALRSMKEITPEFIEKLKTGGESHYQDYIGVVDGHVADRILAAVDQTMDESYDEDCRKYHRSLHKPSLHFSVHFFLYDLLVRIMVKTTLLDRTKYPNSAYVMRKDIPYYKGNSIRNQR